METFEYAITRHSAGEFAHLVYFCSDEGECTLEQVPDTQSEALLRVLNQQGAEGWELVQLEFGKEGILAFWKRKSKTD